MKLLDDSHRPSLAMRAQLSDDGGMWKWCICTACIRAKSCKCSPCGKEKHHLYFWIKPVFNFWNHHHLIWITNRRHFLSSFPFFSSSVPKQNEPIQPKWIIYTIPTYPNEPGSFTRYLINSEKRFFFHNRDLSILFPYFSRLDPRNYY